MAVLTTLFFMWGFMTVMNDVLIPHLKAVFTLSWLQSMLVQFCFFGAYFLGSLAYYSISRGGDDPIQRIGYKRGSIAGSIPERAGKCLVRSGHPFCAPMALPVGPLFVLGLGFTLLRIAANPFVAIIGPSETASSRLNLAAGLQLIGISLAPPIGGTRS